MTERRRVVPSGALAAGDMDGRKGRTGLDALGHPPLESEAGAGAF